MKMLSIKEFLVKRVKGLSITQNVVERYLLNIVDTLEYLGLDILPYFVCEHDNNYWTYEYTDDRDLLISTTTDVLRYLINFIASMDATITEPNINSILKGMNLTLNELLKVNYTWDIEVDMD